MLDLIWVFVVYIGIIFILGACSFFYTKNINDYMLGGRSLSGPVAALGAGASDMSSWLLLALPGAVFLYGINQVWLPLGLALGSFMNWQFVAKRLRVYTEIVKDSITIPAYFENRFNDELGILRTVSAIVILVFFTFYTASGFVAGGLLFSSTFKISYTTGLYVTAFVIFSYTCLGGFFAVAWIDFFQGVLMFLALIAVPIVVLFHLGSFSNALHIIHQQQPAHLFVLQHITFIEIVSLFAWGLGYFGQPHILVRFMAIKDAKNIRQAKYICLIWMYIAMLGAVMTGLLGFAFFKGQSIGDPEKIFIVLAEKLFIPWLAGILLAAVLSATMSTASSQLLASSSAVVEDFYHKYLRKHATNFELLGVSRIVVFIITGIAVMLAYDPKSSILNLVGYAWAGLGASFGPVILISLFWKNMNLIGALFGIAVGAITVIIWPHLKFLGGFFEVYALFPGFILACVSIWVGSKIKGAPSQSVQADFDEMLIRMNK